MMRKFLVLALAKIFWLQPWVLNPGDKGRCLAAMLVSGCSAEITEKIDALKVDITVSSVKESSNNVADIVRAKWRSKVVYA